MLAHAGAADESLAIGMVFAALWVGWIGWSRRRGTGFDRLPAWAGPGLMLAAVALLAASAVVPRAIFGPTAALPAASASGARIASTATISFREPADGTTAAGDQLEVLLGLEGGRVVEGTSRDVTPDTGHIHLSVDGSLVSMTYGTVQVVDLRPYGPGEHVLRAEFVAADHVPFSTPVVDTVTFDVPEAGP